MAKKNQHKHRYRLVGYNYKSLEFSCACGERTSRQPTNKEIKSIVAHGNACNRRIKQIHSIWHSYLKLQEKNKDKIGYDYIKIVEKWAKKYPSVQIVTCDDSCHATSRLVLIPHEIEDEYWGTSVVYMPQCTEEKSIDFFLYPHHCSDLLKHLNDIHAKTKRLDKPKRKYSSLDISYKAKE